MRFALLLTSLALLGCDTFDRASSRAGSEPEPARALEPSATAEATPAEAEAWPEGPLQQGPVTFAMAVYALPQGKGDVETAARAVLAERADTLPLLREAERSGTRSGAWIDVPAMDTFAPPSERELGYFGVGVSEADGRALQDAPKVVVVNVQAATPKDAAALVTAAQSAVGEIAERTGGLPWDELTRQVFGRDAWAARTKAAPVATLDALTQHFTMHMYRDGEYLRIVTLGLGKLGLPELAVAGVTQGDRERMGRLVNATAVAMLAEGAAGPGGTLRVVGNDGTKDTKTTIGLAVNTRQEGDAPGRLATILFPGAGGLQTRQAALLATVFGQPEDELLMADRDDAALQTASKVAKAQLAKLRGHFSGGVPDMETLMVKAPFDTDDGGTEWMWVEVTQWSGDTIRGTLQNRPYAIAKLEEGDRVEVSQASVFDYIHRRADGTEVGGTTNDLLTAQQKRRSGSP